MNAKQLFVDSASLLGNNNKESILCPVFQTIARVIGLQICNCAEDADVVIVGTSQAAITALSASDTNHVVLTAIKDGWEDELSIGLNLTENHPDRFTMYGIFPVPEINVGDVEGLFVRLKVLAQ